MSRVLITPRNWPDIEYPRCQCCGLDMWLMRIAPHGANREARTYGCAACDSFIGANAAAINNRIEAGKDGAAEAPRLASTPPVQVPSDGGQDASK